MIKPTLTNRALELFLTDSLSDLSPIDRAIVLSIAAGYAAGFADDPAENFDGPRRMGHAMAATAGAKESP